MPTSDHPLIQETDRLTLQARLDSAKTASERNELGQFATPTALARDILAYAREHVPLSFPVRFLDPAPTVSIGRAEKP